MMPDLSLDMNLDAGLTIDDAAGVLEMTLDGVSASHNVLTGMDISIVVVGHPNTSIHVQNVTVQDQRNYELL